MINVAALTAIRSKDGQSKKELAHRAGISLQYLCDIEAGRRGCRPAVIARLAEALNVPKSAIEIPCNNIHAA
ncbi:helix-turn-helix domain-containing protein [Spirillospora sp. NPDC048911]|uniref:helix-turn-helix domain-containing protein n=1 Tax=Spirillospora sp. NPDC048911 TaxID=3364527 RepID=UPI00371C92E3